MNIGDLVRVKKTNIFHDFGLGVIVDFQVEPDRIYYDVFFSDSGEFYGIFGYDLETINEIANSNNDVI